MENDATLNESQSMDDLCLVDSFLSPESEKPPHQFTIGAHPTNSSSYLLTSGQTLAVNKSLENILLDASPMDESIDLGNGTILDQTALEQSNLDESSTSKENSFLTEDDTKLAADLTVTDVSIDVSMEEKETELELEETTDSVECAAIPCVEERSQKSLVESELCDNFQKNVELEEKLVENKVDKPETVESIDVESRIRKISEPVVEVDFLEEKGKGIHLVESTRNLMKFFVDDSCGTDTEGKSFFDSFTTSSRDEPDANTTTPPCTSDSDPKCVSHSLSVSPRISLSTANAPSLFSSLTGDPATSPSLFSGPSSIPTDSGVSSIDLFSSNLKMNDEDRRYDAWIPSDSTRQVLVTALTNSAGLTLPLSPSQLSMPGVIIEESLGDPVRDLVQRYMGEQEANKRLVLNADSVPQDDVGLRQLIKGDCLRAAVDLTSRLLTKCGQGPGAINQTSKHTPYSLQLWFCRLSLLMKLHLYAPAECEWEPFGNLDTPDIYFEYHQADFPLRRGSMVPFEMRILHAEFPQFLGRPQETLDRLYYLLAVIAKILSNLNEDLAEDGSSFKIKENDKKASIELWTAREVRVLYCLVNCLLSIKDFCTAIEIFKSLLVKDSSRKVEIYGVLARVYLQVGDIETATKYFHTVDELSTLTADSLKCQQLMNRGAVALGNNNFSEAYRMFKEVTDIERSNVTAINNMAVCALYLGQLKGALRALEELVYSDPQRHLQEGIILNLCTLYELESSRALFKKQNLLRLVSQYKGNGFNVACLKMA